MEEIGKEFNYSVEKIDNWYKRKRRNEAKLGHLQIKVILYLLFFILFEIIN